MKLKQIKANMTELSLDNGVRILFSYETPVAGWDDIGPFRTDNYYSPNTTRHINQYLVSFLSDGSEYTKRLDALVAKDIGRTVSQDFINRMCV